MPECMNGYVYVCVCACARVCLPTSVVHTYYMPTSTAADAVLSLATARREENLELGSKHPETMYLMMGISLQQGLENRREEKW